MKTELSREEAFEFFADAFNLQKITGRTQSLTRYIEDCEWNWRDGKAHIEDS